VKNKIYQEETTDLRLGIQEAIAVVAEVMFVKAWRDIE
jgi:hypothetical protein